MGSSGVETAFQDAAMKQPIRLQAPDTVAASTAMFIESSTQGGSYGSRAASGSGPSLPAKRED